MDQPEDNGARPPLEDYLEAKDNVVPPPPEHQPTLLELDREAR